MISSFFKEINVPVLSIQMSVTYFQIGLYFEFSTQVIATSYDLNAQNETIEEISEDVHNHIMK